VSLRTTASCDSVTTTGGENGPSIVFEHGQAQLEARHRRCLPVNA
jgi:hypothetical protein